MVAGRPPRGLRRTRRRWRLAHLGRPRDGGQPRQVTREPGDQDAPVWSGDGIHLYYTADSGTGRDVWRVAVAGGAGEQITDTGTGSIVRLTADGRGLLYQASDTRSPLLTRPLSGGPARSLFRAWNREASPPRRIPCITSPAERRAVPVPTAHLIGPAPGRTGCWGHSRIGWAVSRSRLMGECDFSLCPRCALRSGPDADREFQVRRTSALSLFWTPYFQERMVQSVGRQYPQVTDGTGTTQVIATAGIPGTTHVTAWCPI